MFPPLSVLHPQMRSAMGRDGNWPPGEGRPTNTAVPQGRNIPTAWANATAAVAQTRAPLTP